MEQNSIIKRGFLSVIQKGKLSHAYIISGHDGCGKMDFAIFAASAILCKNSGAPCEKCDCCVKARSFSHPDITVFSPEEGESFKIDDVRSLLKNIYLAPNESDRKIYIIGKAHTMTVQAQNALLKAFEEPPEGVVFFILTEKTEALLPTVLSRGVIIRIPPLEEVELRVYLESRYKKNSASEIDAAIKLSDGIIGRAEILMTKSSLSLRASASELVKYVFNGNKYETALLLNGFKSKKENAASMMSYIVYATRDVILHSEGASALKFLTQTEAEKYSNIPLHRLLGIADSAVGFIEALNSNANYTVCVGEFCSNIS